MENRLQQARETDFNLYREVEGGLDQTGARALEISLTRLTLSLYFNVASQ